MKYIEALKGWTGYDKSELLEGKYRPIFFGRKVVYYKKRKIKPDWLHSERNKVRVPATKENLRKTALFNIKYGSEYYQKVGRRLLKKVI